MNQTGVAHPTRKNTTLVRIMKKKKLTSDEHKQLGANLQNMIGCMIKISCDIPNTYGKTSKVGRQAVRVYDGLQHLRNIMENQMFKDECPAIDDCHFYYGGVRVSDSFESNTTK